MVSKVVGFLMISVLVMSVFIGVSLFSDNDSNVAGDAIGRFANAKQSSRYVATINVNPDTDGDGLLDSLETELGTDINLVDTDFDGFSDYNEVEVEGTNPLDNNDHIKLLVTIESNNDVVAYLEDGSEYWSTTMSNLNSILPESLVVADGVVAFGSSSANVATNRCVYGLSIHDGSQIWKNCDRNQHGSMDYLSSTGYLYEASGYYIFAYNLQTGVEVDDVYLYSPVVGNNYHQTFFADDENDLIYVLTESGSMKHYDSSLGSGSYFNAISLDLSVGDFVLGDIVTMLIPENNHWNDESRSSLASVSVSDACSISTNQEMYAKAALEVDGVLHLGFDGTAYCEAFIQAYDISTGTSELIFEVNLAEISDLPFAGIGDLFETDGEYLYSEWPLFAMDLTDGSIAWTYCDGDDYADLSYDGNLEYADEYLYHLLYDGQKYEVIKVEAASGDYVNEFGSYVEAFRIY